MVTENISFWIDKEKEIKDLEEKLLSVENAIRGELDKIKTLKTKISQGYRHHDKEKYEAKRRVIMGNLKKYEDEMAEVRKKISELEIPIF